METKKAPWWRRALDSLTRKPSPAEKTAPKDQPAPTPTKEEKPAQEPAAPKEVKKAPATKTYKVTGMQHYMTAIMGMALENEDYTLTKRGLIEAGLIRERVWKYEFYPLKVELVPEPTNQYDPNAIKVMVDGALVGYIKAGSCAHLLKVIREDRLVSIDCDMGGGPYKYISEDMDENGRDVYTLEKEDVPYFVHLRIVE